MTFDEFNKAAWEVFGKPFVMRACLENEELLGVQMIKGRIEELESMPFASAPRREQFMLHFENLLLKMKDTMRAKNADYTGASDDPFANFSRVQLLGICSTEQGFLTRMTDKLCRITSFVQKGTLQVKSESVEDTLMDLANYAVILACYVKMKESK